MTFAGLLDVLHEDNHVFAVNKPSGWPTTHFDGTHETVDRLVKSYIKERDEKPGNVFLGVVHRLDRGTSGALVFAKTSKAASRLSEQFRNGAVEKVYWAVVDRGRAGGLWDKQETGSLDDWLLHVDADRRVEVVEADTYGAKPARLIWIVRNRDTKFVWLELRPHTGRKHQLRVQLAARGCPIYGDRKYGSEHPLGDALALHAKSLTILHPVKADPLTFSATIPKHWRGRFTKLLDGHS